MYRPGGRACRGTSRSSWTATAVGPRSASCPDVAGHKRASRRCAMVKGLIERGVEYHPVRLQFRNWRRPRTRVSLLMQLFVKALQQEIVKLPLQWRACASSATRPVFDRESCSSSSPAEAKTAGNRKLCLTVAANHGGRWDIMQAVNRLARPTRMRNWRWSGNRPGTVSRHEFCAEPDLFIIAPAASSASAISSWQLAIPRLYFTDALWPGVRLRRPRCRHRLVSPARAAIRPDQRALLGGRQAATHRRNPAAMLKTRVITAVLACWRRCFPACFSCRNAIGRCSWRQ